MKKNIVSSEEELKRVIRYWSDETGFPKEKFINHIYFQKENKVNKRVVGSVKESYNNNEVNGFVRIRVRSSSMLARQISGWISGIIKDI